MCYRQSRRGVARQNSEKCKTIVCIANTFTHRHFYTQKLLHTEAFTHRSFYTEAITHKAFTHRSFYIQTLLHTDVFTHRRFYTDTFTHRHVYTQTLLHTDLFTHRSCFYTQTLWHTEAFTHRRFYTQALLHTNTFTHRRFYTQTLLHTEASTHKRFYTQTVLHTNTFTQKHFYTQTLLHTDGFTHKRFYTQSQIVFHTDSLYAYVKQAESATDAPQVQPRARASECSDWIFWSVFTNENLRVLIKTNVWHGISWISKMWLCRSMMVTCLHGARLSDSSGCNGPWNPLNVKIPLQLELKPWQNLLSRTLRRHQNEIVVMPSKIVGKWRRMKW